MTMPPNAHIVFGLLFLAFSACLAFANWGKK